jgi:phosphonate degradation associated HDIG domain protein
MPLTVNDIVTLYNERAEGWYGGEAITQRQHALQCALLAEIDGCSDSLVLACLLHDLGEDAAVRGVDDAHEIRAVRALAHLFPPAVLKPIELHVTAKRYLCANEPGYFDGLSPASRQSLIVQGGPLTQGQGAVFMSVPYATDALSLRRYDDEAKVRDKTTPDLEHYLPLMTRLAYTSNRRIATAHQ